MEAQIKLEYTLLLWMIAIFLVSIVVYALANHDYKQKHGYTKSELKHYRQMMSSSSYKGNNKNKNVDTAK